MPLKTVFLCGCEGLGTEPVFQTSDQDQWFSTWFDCTIANTRKWSHGGKSEGRLVTVELEMGALGRVQPEFSVLASGPPQRLFVWPES